VCVCVCVINQWEHKQQTHVKVVWELVQRRWTFYRLVGGKQCRENVRKKQFRAMGLNIFWLYKTSMCSS
jgi:hypothetical protein